MPTFEPRKKERSTPYFVQNRQDERELTRLTIQDRMITTSMGGVLPEQADPTRLHRVLDIACRTGGWAIEAAQQYPTMSVFGIDTNGRMIEYARAQATAHHVTDRIEFAVMDALLILEFPNGFFDLVNLSFSGSFMLTYDWPKMLSEMLRVTRPGGIVRVMEPEILHQCNSPALTQLLEMFQRAMYRAGHLFEEKTTSIIARLPGMLTQHGCMDVQVKVSPLEFHTGTAEGEAYYNDMASAFRTVHPFLKKWGGISGDYEVIYQQALHEMRAATFHSTWNMLTTWGNKP
ncbi:MAG: methyltransferase domain-containing protein [Chloroflexi bacterium]|nr:methyltransferase domain-containing protein [Chloroflexota bacterium]